MNRIKSLGNIFCFFLILHCVLAFGQPGANDFSFNPLDIGYHSGVGANNKIHTVSLQPDGMTIIGGDFTTYNTYSRTRIARVQTNGLLDPTFDPGTGANGRISITSIQPDGKIIAGGEFTTFNSASKRHVVRLDPNGVIDNTFNIGTGADTNVSCLAVQADGKILLGGMFTSFNGTPAGSIVRLNTDGSVDGFFNTGTGTSGFIVSISIQPDDKIILTGNFSSFNSTAMGSIVRLNADGSIDGTFNTGSGSSNFIFSSAVRSDGKIIIGGDFTTFNGSAAIRLARLNTDGTLDGSFITTSGADAAILSLAIQSDDKVVAGGTFGSYSGISRQRLARVNTDGTLDVTYSGTVGANAMVRSLVIQTDDKAVFAGDFNTYNGKVRNHIARATTAGSEDAVFGKATGLSNVVTDIFFQPDGKILVLGSFETSNEDSSKYLIRLNADGSTDNSFDIGTGPNNPISSLALQPDGGILAVGNFTTFNGSSHAYIVRLNPNGSVDNTFNAAPNSFVYAVAVQSDGKILIGGDFSVVNSSNVIRLARLTTTGTVDGSFITTNYPNNSVGKIILLSNGKILIGGFFTGFGASSRNHIARLSSIGGLDGSFNPGTGITGILRDMKLLGNGKILVGGLFSSYDGNSVNNIARINANGAFDNSFMAGTGANLDVITMSVQNNGKTFIGGGFTAFDGHPAHFIARLDSSGAFDNSFLTGTGAENYVDCSGIQSDGRILIGGDFVAYNDTGRNHIARIIQCGSTSRSITDTACDSYTLNAQTYTSSGIYNQTLTNVEGCDSLLTLDLTIKHSSTFSLNAQACNKYTLNSHNYFSSGAYTQTLTNAVSCDSIITLHLTINHIDSTVVQLGTHLSSNQTGAAYQWIDCSTGLPISGATLQAFDATANGQYAVAIHTTSCTDTSACYTVISAGLNDLQEIFSAKVFPNPTSGDLFLNFGDNPSSGTLKIYSLTGQLVVQSIYRNQKLVKVELSAEAGIYFLEIISGDKIFRSKIIKE